MKLKWFALIGISFLAFTAFLDFTIVNTALPFIQKDLNANVLQLQWLQNIFVIVLSISMITVGKLGDLWGRKKVFYVGVAVFGLAAIGAALSSSIHMLTVFRAIQGLGASILFVASPSILSDTFSKNGQAKAIGIYSGITGIGLTVGPFIGGILIAALSWRWVFWVNIPLIAIGLVLCLYSLRKVTPPRDTVKIDWISFCLLVVGLGLFSYGIVSLSWLMVPGFLALVYLCVLDFKKKAPLLSLKTIFKDRLIELSLLSCCVAGTVTTVFLFFDPLYLENVRELSPFAIGLLIASMPVAQILISFYFHSLLKKFGMVKLLFFSIFAGVIGTALHGLIGYTTPLFLLIVPFFFLGIPWGLSNTCFVTSVNEKVAPQKIGETIGTIATIWNIAGSLMLSVSSVVFHHASTYFMSSFHTMVLVNLIFLIIIAGIAIFRRQRRTRVSRKS